MIDDGLCANPIIRECYLDNRWFSEDEYLNISLHDWTSVHFEKTFDYDFTPDTSELMKDTFISPLRSNWYQSYDHCASKNRWNKNRPRYVQEETRCVLRYLKGYQEETREEIKDFLQRK